MNNKKCFKAAISIVIVLSMLISLFPLSLAFESKNDDYTQSKIVQEIIEKREESSKTFVCEDGSYIAVTYSEPVHFKTEMNGKR